MPRLIDGVRYLDPDGNKVHTVFLTNPAGGKDPAQIVPVVGDTLVFGDQTWLVTKRFLDYEDGYVVAFVQAAGRLAKKWPR